MTPQQIAKSIADELRQHPERWTQGTGAKDSTGRPVLYDEPSAVCWCLATHCSKRLKRLTPTAFFVALGFETFGQMLDWNDATGRTVEQVIARCEAAS